MHQCGARNSSAAGSDSVMIMHVIVIVVMIVTDDLVDQIVDHAVKRHRILLQADA